MTTRARKERKRLPNFAIGLIAILLVIVGLFLAFTKRIPFTDRGYELTAMVRNAQNLAEKSPVRIAGVNVGEVTKVEPVPESSAAEMTMTITEQGRPINEDVRIQLRPRLFLEGNLFVDVRPGSPSAPGAGGRRRDPDPADLELGPARPDPDHAAGRRARQPAAPAQGAGRRLPALRRRRGPAASSTSPAARPTRTRPWSTRPSSAPSPDDLSGLVANFDRVFVALNRNQTQLQDLVTNLRIVTGSFAAEGEALEASIRQLPGVLDAAEPGLRQPQHLLPAAARVRPRGPARGSLDAVPTIDAALPFMRQLRPWSPRASCAA